VGGCVSDLCKGGCVGESACKYVCACICICVCVCVCVSVRARVRVCV